MKNTERFINNWDFFEDCAGLPELELQMKEKPEYHIHIWIGFLHDILGKPPLDGLGWHGFTRDDQEGVRTGQLGGEYEIDDIDDYIDDLIRCKRCKNDEFYFEESKDAYQLIFDFLLYAKENNLTVVGTLEF